MFPINDFQRYRKPHRGFVIAPTKVGKSDPHYQQLTTYYRLGAHRLKPLNRAINVVVAKV